MNSKIKYTIFLQSDLNHAQFTNRFISSVIRVLDNMYYEIRLYNRNYWCKFLGMFWLTIGSIIAMVAFIAFLGDVQDVVIRVMLTCYLVIYVQLLLFVIHISNDVYNEPMVTYKLFNTYMCTNRTMPLVLRFKVSFN